MTTQRQIEAVAKAIDVVWESHGDGYLSAGLFEAMAKAAIEAAEAAAWEPHTKERETGHMKALTARFVRLTSDERDVILHALRIAQEDGSIYGAHEADAHVDKITENIRKKLSVVEWMQKRER